MTTMTTTTSRSPAPSIWRPGLRAGLLAGVVNLGLLTGGRALDVDLTVATGPRTVPVTAGHVVASTLLAVMAGTAVIRLLATRRHGARAVQWVAAVVTVLSLGAPLSMATDLATALLLAAMHAVTGGIFVAAMRRGTGTAATPGPPNAQDPAPGPRESTGAVAPSAP